MNFQLLTHRRLVLTDSSIFLGPMLVALLRAEPEYQDLVRGKRGSLVAAMRKGVDSFGKLAADTLASGAWSELTREDMEDQARFLDGLSLQAVETPTTQNRSLMDDYGRWRLLDVEHWRSVGLDDEIARQLVNYVPPAMVRNNAASVRQTEFWEFAQALQAKRTLRLAQLGQRIREETSVVSLGVMAMNLGLPPVFPATAGQAVERWYDMHLPFTTEDGLVPSQADLEPADDPAGIRQDFDMRAAAATLTPSQILEIRDSSAFESYVRAVEHADARGTDLRPEIIRRGWEDYRDWLQGYIGVAAIDALGEWKKLRWRSWWLNWAERSTLAFGLFSVITSVHAAVNMLPLGAALWIGLMKSGLNKRTRKLEVDGRQAFRELVREQGRMQAELYGPIERVHWNLKHRP